MDTTTYLWPGVFRAPTAWREAGAVERAAKGVIAELGANRRAESPLLTVMKLVDWHVARCLPLPQVVLDALRTAMRLTRRRPSTALHLPREKTAAKIAWRLAAAPMKQEHRLQLFQIISWFADRRRPLPYAVWWAIAVALDLGDADGLREGVRERLGAGRSETFHTAARLEGIARAKVGDVRRQVYSPDAVAALVGVDRSTAYAWQERPEWESSAWGHGLVTRWNRGNKS